MEDTNDNILPETKRPVPRTDQLRIVGAEEAASLVAKTEQPDTLAWTELSDPEESPSPSPSRNRTQRSVFESVPDAPDSLLFGDNSDDSADPFGPIVPRPIESPTARSRSDDSGTRRRPIRAVPDEDISDASLGKAPLIKVSNPDPSRELELPHWTEPPTGQVPKVLLDDDRRDNEEWSSFGSAPRWRDNSSDWDGDVSDLGDDLPRIGALDDSERPLLDEFFAFDDSPATRVSASGGVRRNDQSWADGDEFGEEVEDLSEQGRTGQTRQAVGAGGLGLGETSRRRGDDRNIGLSAGVGIGLGILAIVLFRLGPAYVMVLVTAIAGVGGIEFLNAARSKGHHPATLVGLLGTAAFPLAVYYRGEAAFPIMALLVLFFSLLWFVFGVDSAKPAINIGITLLGVGFVGFTASFAALILRTPVIAGRTTNILLAAVLATVAHDVFAYFVGRNAGRSPLTPISPGKTVEGLLGGCLGAIVVSVLFNDILLNLKPFDGFRNALLLGLVIAVVAPLGDLCESLVKRDFGVKDMGNLLPGHGGVLDRFDALLFVMPAVYYLARLLDLFVV